MSNLFAERLFDISQIESQANTINAVLDNYGLEAIDVYTDLLDKMTLLTRNTLGTIACGVDAFYGVGCFAEDEGQGDILDGEIVPFVGRFDRAAIVLGTLGKSSVQHAGFEVSEVLAPSLVFTPIDPRDLPDSYYERYHGASGALYGRLAVPLFGMPVMIEPLDLIQAA